MVILIVRCAVCGVARLGNQLPAVALREKMRNKRNKNRTGGIHRATEYTLSS